MKKHIVYVISNVNKSLGLEWTLSELKTKYTLSAVILNNSQNTPLRDFLVSENIPFAYISYHGKKNIPSAFLKLFFFLNRRKVDIIHTHLFDATIIGLIAAKFAGIKKRIYTRHHSTYHHQYFPAAIKYDLLCNKYATDIISISHATYRTLTELENVPKKKIINIPHGFDLNIFNNINANETSSIKLKWNIPEKGPVIGVIARHIEWKGVQYIIPAFKNFLLSYPNATLLLANANGPYHNTLMRLLSDIPSKNYRIIPFEENVRALYNTFDMYIHTPIDPLSEAFGQTYIEALASGIPSIFTLSGIAAEFIEHKKNALVVGFCNSKEILESMIMLQQDNTLAKKISENGLKSIKKFNLKQMMVDIETTYDN